MSTVYEWNKYMNLLHEFALIEDTLRVELTTGNSDSVELSRALLWEHFGVAVKHG